MQDVLVLVHGAFHGPWCWQPTIRQLEAEGIRCVSIDLNRGGLAADSAALQGVVDGLRRESPDPVSRIHAIGHSLGCPSVAMLDPDSIASAFFLAGPILGPGLPGMEECTFADFGTRLLPQDDGRAFISRDDAREVFYHRCTSEEAEWALDRLRPTFVYGGEATPVPLWDQIPTTYIECTDDRAVRPDYQRAVGQACKRSVQIETDHSPMLGRPEALARIVLESIG